MVQLLPQIYTFSTEGVDLCAKLSWWKAWGVEIIAGGPKAS